MLLSKKLGAALGCASLLMALAVPATSYAAAAPVKKAAPKAKPTVNFEVGGGVAYALRHTSNGCTHADCKNSIDDINSDSLFDSGFAFPGTGFYMLGSTSQGGLTFGALIQAGTFHEPGVNTNSQLSGRTIVAGQNAAGGVEQNDWYQNPLQLTKAEVFASTAGFTVLAGYGETASSLGAKASLSPVNTATLQNWATVKLVGSDNNHVDDVTRPAVIHQFAMGQAQDDSYRLGARYEMQGINVGIDWVTQAQQRFATAVDAGSIGLGAGYAGKQSGFDYSVRLGWANGILLGTEVGIPTNLRNSGTELNVSAAVATQGFDMSVGFSNWNPEEKTVDSKKTGMKKATGYTVNAGYTFDAGLGGDTNINVTYFNAKNANQPSDVLSDDPGLTDKLSEAKAWGVGLTQNFNANSTVFVKAVMVNDGYYNTRGVNAGGNITFTKREYKDVKGFMFGMSYTF